MIDSVALAAIGGYQRYVSPYKGFCCAYGAYSGRRSCSSYAVGVVRRLGAMALWVALPRQFDRCKAAFAALSASRPSKRKERSALDACDCNPFDAVDCVPCDCSF